MINPHGEDLLDFFGGHTKRKRGSGHEQGLIMAQLARDRNRELYLDAEINRKTKTSTPEVSDKDDGLSGVVEDKREKFVKETRKQQITEESEEIRELQLKLRQSYILKSVSAQIAEKEAERVKKSEQMKAANDLINRARYSDMEIERINMEEEFQKRKNYGQDLRKQFSQAEEERKAKRNQERLIEKQMVDEITQKYNEERLEEFREEQAKKNKFKIEFHDFLQMQNNWKKIVKEENEDVGDLIIDKHTKALEIKAKKQIEWERKQKISEEIGKKIQKIHDQKIKKQNILEDLYIEEKKVNEEKKDRAKQEKEIREREEAISELYRMTEEKFKRRHEKHLEDIRYTEMQARILAEQERLDQSASGNKQKQMMENQRIVKECLDEKKRRRAQEIAMMLKNREMQLQEEQQKAELIRQTKIDILKEHRNNLLGYFPQGVLTENEMLNIPGERNIV